MAGKFLWKYFSEVDLSDVFFDPLKSDYPEFETWYNRKASEHQSALAYIDDEGVGAFVYYKEENEPVNLVEKILPAMPRLKIGTLRLAERIRNQRLGEGAIGVCLWKWRDLGFQQVYVTVFEKQEPLIRLLVKFGFELVGHKSNGECVYVKDKSIMDISSIYGSFPYIVKPYNYAGILPINQEYHDKLFPYSELHGVSFKSAEEDVAGNGVTKAYIATPYFGLTYYEGEPVAFYRKSTNAANPTYRSVATSYGRIKKVTQVRSRDRAYMSIDDYLICVGNKSIFSTDELRLFYSWQKDLYIIELIYCGFFGAGHNVTHHDLKNAGLFSDHPYQIRYDMDQFEQLLEMGGLDAQGTFVHKP